MLSYVCFIRRDKLFIDYITQFRGVTQQENLPDQERITQIIDLKISTELNVFQYKNEFWTAKQRQASSLHEVSYRACFKPQLPRFFINLFTKVGDVVYDPFSGRGTTVLEAALLGRRIVANDINPLSKILSKPRLIIPDILELEARLKSIPLSKNMQSSLDLSMFYEEKTFQEILSIRAYLEERKQSEKEDDLDYWIRMIATNRLTGHSRGFFSVYTLPPNQATSAKRQLKINIQREQKPEYRNTKEIILKKSRQLIKDVTISDQENLKKIAENALFLCEKASETKIIPNNSVDLVVTSPPFLDIVQYADDNWLRCWFNQIGLEEVSKKISVIKKVEDWCMLMEEVFSELYRLLKSGGHVAFEVGEVRKAKVNLDQHIANIAVKQGFSCLGIMVNEQSFTKTSNIWGIGNNQAGTNSNRIVVCRKK